jgi:hypothetical protein
MDIDHDKLDAALERLEAEKERRLAERIEAGEVVRVPLSVVAGSEAEARAKVEQAKADALKELRDSGDRREVVFDVTTVATGVARPGEAAGPAWKPQVPAFLPKSISEVVEVVEEVLAREEAPAPIVETYVAVQIGRCLEDDAGTISEGWFSVDDGQVIVTNASGKYVGSRALLGEDARVVAKKLLREKAAPEDSGDFNRPLDYPLRGWA